MKSNKDILDEFGELIATTAFDSQYGSLIQVLNGEGNQFLRLKSLVDLFDRFNVDEKVEIQNYIFNLISGTLFDFLKIFEENEQFKLIYDENGKQINLLEISEMLKAEPIIKNGWIERFSKELKNNISNS
tara:strand:+ start:106016 stop:106405 length:390 start_codon:yes stop_codon:yes gene_type:complete